MNELRVIFSAARDHIYRARLTDADGHARGVDVAFTPFLTDTDYEELRWYLEEFMDLPDGGAVVRAQRIDRDLERWGGALHAALFTAAENLDLLQTLLAAPEPRALTIATSDPELLRLPWELIADAAGSLAQRLAVRRQLDQPATHEPCVATLPVRILYIVSRPADAGFLDPRLTSKALFDALDPLGTSVRVDFCRPPTVARLEEMLRDGQRRGEPYHLVHFDGHGVFLPRAQIGALCFERPDVGAVDSETEVVLADRLGDVLASFAIPLVVLEASRSAAVGKTAIFRSVAPRLIEAGVGSVLSMGHAVHVEAARLLLDRFYRELAAGSTIGQAVAQARKALRATPARWIEAGPHGRTIALQDWFLPHLYQRDGDHVLIPPGAAASQPARHYDVFLSHSHNESDRVEALARTLSNTYGLRVWLDKWEPGPGTLEPQTEEGIRASRFTVVVGSEGALRSKWVQWEIDTHNACNPQGDRLIPIKFEALQLPPGLDELLWVDFTDRDRDADNTARLARLIRGADAEDARRRRGFRSPARGGNVPGPFPAAPPHGFHGRARELHELERRFRSHRGIALHAMGGMGKTSLATEAADWWTRSGLFRDGACFLSFEQFAGADRAIQVLGTYMAGPRFEQLPAAEQRRRVIELFQQHAVLMVWDNFESTLPQFGEDPDAHGRPYTDEVRRELAELFRDLTAGPGKGCLLVTCRPGETGLPDAQPFELRGLARADSLWLLSTILRRDGLTLAEPRFSRERLDPLLDDLQHHPLSLELVGPRLRTLTPEAIRADFGALVATLGQAAPERRNQSLLASFEFSRRHLSGAAREALRWLGLFRGGVFELHFLRMSQLAPDAWAPIRRELQDIALVRCEDDVQIGHRPFLRFHPTLAAIAADPAMAGAREVRERFVYIYVDFMKALDEALHGAQPRVALEVLRREEANYRTAVHWAVAARQLPAAAALGDTLRIYLERSGRLGERDSWVRWLKGILDDQAFTSEAATYQQQHAYTLAARGDWPGAIAQLEALIERLLRTTEFDPAVQLALAVMALGDVLNDSGESADAIPMLREAISQWEALVERTGGQPWAALLSTPDYKRAWIELGNLAVTMGTLANALSLGGQHDEALALAEQCLIIHQRLGNDREVVADHGRVAGLLMTAYRWDEADVRYALAAAGAREAGDKVLEGAFLQHRGVLADHRQQLDAATQLYKAALHRFQEAGNDGAVMRTYNLLGVVEQKAGRLAEGRAWHEKSREIAVALKDRQGIAQAAQNIGAAWLAEGEAARGRGDEPAARRTFEHASRSVEESWRVWAALGNKPFQAISSGQLAIIALRLGDLAAADRHAHDARGIRESLGLREVVGDYDTLAQIAHARGDTAAAAEWTGKRDVLLEALDRRTRGA